jgi:hypothetical protein
MSDDLVKRVVQVIRGNSKPTVILSQNEAVALLDRAEAAEARLAKVDRVQEAQKLFNFYAVKLVTYGATVTRCLNLENAWLNLKTQSELAELTGESR